MIHLLEHSQLKMSGSTDTPRMKETCAVISFNNTMSLEETIFLTNVNLHTYEKDTLFLNGRHQQWLPGLNVHVRFDYSGTSEYNEITRTRRSAKTFAP